MSIVVHVPEIVWGGSVPVPRPTHIQRREFRKNPESKPEARRDSSATLHWRLGPVNCTGGKLH